MSRRLIINPLAEDDLSGARDWYETQRDGLGDEFLLCVEETLDRIRRRPEIQAKIFGELRRGLVRRFPYGVFYRVDDRQITVVAIYHASRNPRGWQKRG